MKKYLLGGVLLCAGAFIVSCSSDEELTPSGEGTISLDIRTETGFLSRAVNEADYMNVNNYTVQLLSGEEVQNEWKYTDLPESMQVNAGTYQVKAYYGEDVAASTETMYVEGGGQAGQAVLAGAHLEARKAQVGQAAAVGAGQAQASDAVVPHAAAGILLAEGVKGVGALRVHAGGLGGKAAVRAELGAAQIGGAHRGAVVQMVHHTLAVRPQLVGGMGGLKGEQSGLGVRMDTHGRYPPSL